MDGVDAAGHLLTQMQKFKQDCHWIPGVPALLELHTPVIVVRHSRVGLKCTEHHTSICLHNLLKFKDKYAANLLFAC